ncbi:MAG: ABC transporter permease [Lachnospiraceae bacterium]|nr:ABC transporter permease [Lachnospiraceae bacterium]
MNKIILSLAKSRARFLILLLILELIILGILNPSFLTVRNLVEILQFGATLFLLAIGESLVIMVIPGGIDISIGSIVSLSCVTLGYTYRATANMPLAILCTVIAGAVMGCINGLFVGFFNMPPLIATLGTQYAFASLALYITNGVAISGFPESFEWLSLEQTFGIPNQILFMVIPVVAVMLFLIYRTHFGRNVYLTGDNAEAAKFAAVKTRQTIFFVFMIAGILSALGAIVNCSWLMTARADAGSGMEMNAITVAMLGGISAVKGGRGHLAGVIIGTVIITMLNSGMQIAGINSMWILAVTGLILIISIVMNSGMSRFVERMTKV